MGMDTGSLLKQPPLQTTHAHRRNAPKRAETRRWRRRRGNYAIRDGLKAARDSSWRAQLPPWLLMNLRSDIRLSKLQDDALPMSLCQIPDTPGACPSCSPRLPLPLSPITPTRGRGTGASCVRTKEEGRMRLTGGGHDCARAAASRRDLASRQQLSQDFFLGREP